MSSTQPEIVVGIDFGMTFTGVAYWRRHMPLPKAIQRWPGKPHETNRKVPSVLHYPATGGNPEWGFPCQYQEHKEEWFKRYLDFQYLEGLRAEAPNAGLPTVVEVKKWYRDYMRALFNYISRFLQEQMGVWTMLHVEFVFSLPTTFGSQEITTNLRELLLEAGFGRGFHTLEFGLTESQASAVDAAKDSSKTFAGGDVLLVCDAGGGTTDVALLEQTSLQGGMPELRELTNVPGIDVGSTNIDLAFEKLVESRLQASGLNLNRNTSWTMMHSPDFQMWKCSFGELSSQDTPRFLVQVPLLNEAVSNRQAGIERGKMAFTHADFESIFDPQISEIIMLLRKQLDFMAQNHPGRNVRYLILSGGLGSSPYLMMRLRAAFVHDSHIAAPSLEILVSDEPQLAVCRGLVIDRMQRITTMRNVLTGRICPASYGVLCDMPYDKNNRQHVGQDVYKHAIFGVPYVRNQVKWMIKKGQVIDVDNHIAHKFTRQVCRLKDGDADDSRKKIWKDSIVISHQEAKRLPTSLSHSDCHVFCDITSDLSTLSLNDFDLIKEQKSWYRVGSREKYRIAEHQIKVVIGSTDIKFELWYKGGQFTRTNSIRVDWQEGAAISTPNVNRRLDSNILGGVRKRSAINAGRNRERMGNGLRNGMSSPAGVRSPRLFTRDRSTLA